MQSSGGAALPAARKQWIDVGKGFCMVLVVVMHVSLWIENAYMGEGDAFWWQFSQFFVAIRMPLFFFISGYLAAAAVRRPLGASKARTIGFYYLYVLWTVLFLARLWLPIPGFDETVTPPDLLIAVTLPTSYWYLYALALFFLIAWAAQRVLGDRSVWLVIPLFGVALAAPLIDAALRPLVPTEAFSFMFGHMAVNFVWFFAGIHGRSFWDAVMRQATPTRAITLASVYAVAVLSSMFANVLTEMRPVLAIVGLLLAANVLAFLPRNNITTRTLERVGGLTLPVYIFHIFALSVVSGLVGLTLGRQIAEHPYLFGAILPPLAAVVIIWASMLAGRLILATPLRWTLSPDWLKQSPVHQSSRW
ncbi:acyltransferase family protein [Microbacterium sp. NPDC077184]|uniref:acyltransferase family protein n=1 Tax=Microbacterium sp. NPDC077184 TaxID=3154764 RepID=UPI00343EA84C